MANGSGIKAVVIGGGTGTFTVLSGLKDYVKDITAIVNMVDDGGSTGILRDELGALPPGDVRQALVALSSQSQRLRQLFNYRFAGGTFEGHAFGNLLLSALEKITGSFAEAVSDAGNILGIQGKVLPVTTKDVRLGLKYPDGKTVVGERTITQSVFRPGEKPEVFLQPAARINPAAKEAIIQADLVVIGPGNLYSSLIPTLLVRGMSRALQQTRAKKIYICNLVTKPGQTEGYKVSDFVAAVEGYAGQLLDYVIYNTAKPAEDLLVKYAKEGELWVEPSQPEPGQRYQMVGEALLGRKVAKPNPHDKFLSRTLIRHDSAKLAKLIMRLYFT